MIQRLLCYFVTRRKFCCMLYRLILCHLSSLQKQFQIWIQLMSLIFFRPSSPKYQLKIIGLLDYKSCLWFSKVLTRWVDYKVFSLDKRCNGLHKYGTQLSLTNQKLLLKMHKLTDMRLPQHCLLELKKT